MVRNETAWEERYLSTREQNIPYTCISEEEMSHILVIRRTNYPIYLYFRGQIIAYTGISQERMSDILEFQTEYPIYLYFRWQNVPRSYKYICVIYITILQRGCRNSALPTETVLEHVGTQRSPVAIRYRGIGPCRWRKIDLLPHVVEQSISGTRYRLNPFSLELDIYSLAHHLCKM